MYTIHLAKEPFKFSCSHFTILAPAKAERLHGHNYQIQVEIEVEKLDPKLGFAFDFNEVKPLIKQLCDELDERILLPTSSPFLRLDQSGGEVRVEFDKKRYTFPKEDTALLPLCNITSEELARHFCDALAKQMSALPNWSSLSVQVEETRGQSVRYRRSR